MHEPTETDLPPYNDTEIDVAELRAKLSEWWGGLALDGTDASHQQPLGKDAGTIIYTMQLGYDDVPELNVTTSVLEQVKKEHEEDPEWIATADVELRPGVFVNGSLLGQPEVLSRLVEMNILQPDDLEASER